MHSIRRDFLRRASHSHKVIVRPIVTNMNRQMAQIATSIQLVDYQVTGRLPRAGSHPVPVCFKGEGGSKKTTGIVAKQ